MDKGDDPYKILGVHKSATTSDIRKAYRKLALEHHPDKQTDEKSRDKAQHIFANISAAYEILSDNEQREEYDKLQKEQVKTTGKARGFDQKKANTAVRFNDPYEVFKRDFEKQFGCAYPGAKYDFIEPPNSGQSGGGGGKQNSFKKLTSGGGTTTGTKNKAENNSNSNNNNNTTSSSSDDNKGNKDGKNRGGGILSRFRGGGKNNNKDCKDIVVHDDNNKNNKKNDDRLVNYDPSKRDPNDNRPIAMETNTKQIKHDDGTIETITEMKITRPDGSTETFRQTDKAHKQPGWSGKSPTKNNNEKLSLTNGNTAKSKQLTNGTPVASSSSPKGKKGPYQLTTTTNTNKKAAASTTANNNNKTEAMAPGRKSTTTKVKSKELLQLDGPLVSTPPKTRRLIKWGGGNKKEST